MIRISMMMIIAVMVTMMMIIAMIMMVTMMMIMKEIKKFMITVSKSKFCLNCSQ